MTELWFSSLFRLYTSLGLLLLVPIFGRDFYAPANLIATFLIDIFSVKCAVTILSRRSSEYAFIGFNDKMIFHYLLYRITAGTAVYRDD
ncbi:hypothetical protein Q5692_38370 [Microcoleus sp. C2C3]|uniref:hypothetical protein n=1 Tax=unclassified Microcoleus TaxID=2642155 RepID=UPI002FD707E5